MKELTKILESISSQLSTAQKELLKESQKTLAELDGESLLMPTAIRQVVKPNGETKLEHISVAEIPLRSMIELGTFQITHVKLNMPLHAGERKDSQPEWREDATLELKYEYRTFESVPRPIVIETRPSIKLHISRYERDPQLGDQCLAQGLLELSDGESGKPLKNTKVFLAVEPGNITPSSTSSDDKGRVPFRITSRCQRDGSLETQLSVFAVNSHRSFSIFLTANTDKP